MEDLVMRSKNGDTVAFSELILLVRTDLYRTAFGILRNDADSQDAVQETIIKIYYNLHKLRINKNFRAWSRVILINICKKMYKANKHNLELCDDDVPDDGAIEASISDINFDNIFAELDERDREIFHLHFVNGLTSKAIARKLNMTHSNVRSRLSRGSLKLREKHTPATLFIFALCMFIATSVIAVSIAKYVMGLFNLSDVGINNDGILMAIENLDWYQEIDMDYQDLGDGYKIKMEYLLMDEMNLYMVFDLESEKDLSKYTDVSLPDLRIVDENGNVICDKSDLSIEQSSQVIGSKLIENNSTNVKFLVYMYAESFPISKALDMNLSTVLLTRRNILSTTEDRLNGNISFNVELLEKFIARQHIDYISNSDIIKKAIVTETGFYALIDFQTLDTSKKYLIDENGNIYNCYSYTFTNLNTLNHIVFSTFNNLYTNSFNLLIFDNNYELVKAN